MEIIQILTLVALLVVLAEVTVILSKLPGHAALKRQGRWILIDTSVLIDGRIVSVAKSGFVSDRLVIPRSVIGELQFLADNADHEKRARARHGLDVVTELQSLPQVKVRILQDGAKAQEGVDERLLKLAKKHSAAVCTIDYNLNKVAVVEGITVLNVNELAQSLRMAYLPGEKMQLELVQKGQDSHQGVGYLGDGTMVVVENASKYVGSVVDIEFIRSLQTAAGKMMFARLAGAKSQSQPTQKQAPQNTVSQAPVKSPLQQNQKPAAKAQTATGRKPTVYHSDKVEQGKTGAGRVGSAQKNQSENRGGDENQAQTRRASQQRQQRNRRDMAKPRGGGEDALLELVNKQ